MSENREDAIALAVEILANDLKRLAAIVDRLVYETSPERTIPSNIVGNAAAAVPSEALWVLGPPGGGSSFLYESVAPEAARLGILIPYDALFRNEEAFGQGYGNIPDLKAGSQNGTPLVSPQASEVPQNFTSQEQIEAFAQKLSESPELRALILNNPNLRDNLLNAPELAALFASEELQAHLGNQVIGALLDPEAPYNLFTQLTERLDVNMLRDDLRIAIGEEETESNPLQDYIEMAISNYFAQSMTSGEDGEAVNPFQAAIDAALQAIDEARKEAIFSSAPHAPYNLGVGDMLNIALIAINNRLGSKGAEGTALGEIEKALREALAAIRNAQPASSRPIDGFAHEAGQRWNSQVDVNQGTSGFHGASKSA